MPVPEWLRDLDASVRRYTTDAVRWLIYINLGIYIFSALLLFFLPTAGLYFYRLFSCTELSVRLGFVWQFFTYMFLHDPQNPFHVFVNMLMLWFIGPVFEQQWGRREFLRFYIVCGIGAALVYQGAALVLPFMTERPMFMPGMMFGASGAIFGLLFAFGYLYPEQPVLFGMLIPMPARVMVALLILMGFLGSITPSGDKVAHVAHLAGILVAYLYLKFWRRRGPRSTPRFQTIQFR